MAKRPPVTIDTLCNAITAYYPDAKVELVRKAYAFADEAHRGQLRSSGDPYIIHPVEVAQTLAELRLDLHSIITGLLHDTVEDTSVTLEQIEKEFPNHDILFWLDKNSQFYIGFSAFIKEREEVDE